MTHHLEQITHFIIEIEKLKNVERKTKPIGMQRYENSAEHSWQIALLALSLSECAERPVNPLRVVTMLLLHDIVEIDTGDKFAYDANHDDYENELKAAERIFALLPQAIHDKYLTLWKEFEAAESDDARFAKAIDRLMPVLQNLHNDCQSWVENDISISQVLAKNACVEDASPALWKMVSEQVVEKGKAFGLRD